MKHEMLTDMIRLEMSIDELVIINNALNEVCNALDIQEFALRIGSEIDEAKKLLEQVDLTIQGFNKTNINK